MATIVEMQNTILEQLQAGEFLKGMEDYYADDAVNEEVTGAKMIGKAAIIENEKKILAQVAAFHGCEVFSSGGSEASEGNGVTFAEYQLRVDMKDGSTFNPKQVQVTEWQGGKVKHIRFYYDPAQL